MQQCAPLVGRHVLARLVRGGVGGIRGEMGQACFKALSMLFKSQVRVFGVSTSEEETREAGEGTGQSGAGTGAGGGGGGGGRGKRKGRGGSLFGLSPKQLRALLVVLQMAVAETEHQNATFTLIKAVVSRQVMLPEVRFSLNVLRFVNQYRLLVKSIIPWPSVVPVFFVSLWSCLSKLNLLRRIFFFS